LGATGRNSGLAVQLQLEKPVGSGWAHGVEFLLSCLCRCGEEGVSAGLLAGFGAPPTSAAAGGLGRLPAHRSRLVRDYIASLQGSIATAYLPPYAPKLNPVEYIWTYWKQHELPDVCPQDYWQLTETARPALGCMRHRPPLISAFWQQKLYRGWHDSILCGTQ
jgi:hypothetical protein